MTDAKQTSSSWSHFFWALVFFTILAMISCTEQPQAEAQADSGDPPFTPEEVEADTVGMKIDTTLGVAMVINWDDYKKGIDSTFTIQYRRAARFSYIGPKTGARMKSDFYIYAKRVNEQGDTLSSWVGLTPDAVAGFYPMPK